ncbi:hypothetical protein GOBAR_AA24399 [Gossypium barbadense]|uniref:Nucleoside phosphorylase domain-containing protein n=1 Tax=Gossypium barbadense TaxID=3634 RepID=A0A2P5WZ08_GOSBA|nr:hypothetical protein GOBAR_AA24399 [Gossypium barbadense]
MAATQLKPCLVLLLTFSLLAFASAISRNRIKSLNQIKEVFATEKDAFFASGSFKPDPKFPFIDLSWQFLTLLTQNQTNAVAATQQMVDLFDIKGIIHFGIAGNTNNSMSIGDVTIPNQIAHTGLWEWLKRISVWSGSWEKSRVCPMWGGSNTNGTLDSADVAQLEIGDNIVPKGNGTNLLGHIGYMEEEY